MFGVQVKERRMKRTPLPRQRLRPRAVHADGHQGRNADLRCKCEIERAARRKRTLGAATQFFRCANAANGGKEPKLTSAATAAFCTRRNLDVSETAQALNRFAIGALVSAVSVDRNMFRVL